ncbi:hypothetical protein Tco_0585096 [Tanacetum coccineum]
MPILHSFEENKLEYEDEDVVEIKMMGTKMDKEFLEHNLYENDITSIICHNFSLTSNPPVRGREKTRSHLEYIARRSSIGCVYAIVIKSKVAKEIWDRVKLLIQGTKLSLQEKECKLYDEFDKFSFVKGEPLY